MIMHTRHFFFSIPGAFINPAKPLFITFSIFLWARVSCWSLIIFPRSINRWFKSHKIEARWHSNCSFTMDCDLREIPKSRLKELDCLISCCALRASKREHHSGGAIIMKKEAAFDLRLAYIFRQLRVLWHLGQISSNQRQPEYRSDLFPSH